MFKINKSDLSYLNINIILDLYNKFIYTQVKDILRIEIKKTKRIIFSIKTSSFQILLKMKMIFFFY